MIRDLDERGIDGFPLYDVCVVGSGPAGITLAAELVDSGLSVCVLESGRLRPDKHGDTLRKVVSHGITIKDYSRERVLGGASSTWAGLSSPLDEIDLAPRDFLRHSGWPLQRADLLPYYARAATRYRFAPLALFEPDGFGLLKARGDAQFTWDDVDEKIFLAASEPQHFGREHQAIFDGGTLDLYLDATLLRLECAGEASGQATVRAGIVRSRSGAERRLQARVFVLATGGIENARILLNSTDHCAAGLGNGHDQVGRYLMNHPKNYHGVVTLTRPLRDVPYLFGCLYQGYAGYAGLHLSESLQRQHGLLNSYVRFEPLFPWSGNQGVEALVFLVKRSESLFRGWKQRREGKLVTLRDYSETGDDSDLQNERKGVLDWFKLGGLILINLVPVTRYAWARLREGRAPAIHKVRLRNFMEMEPDPDNRVTLCDELDPHGQRVPRVAHQTTALDRRSLCELHRVLTTEMERNGFGTLSSDIERVEPWPIDMDASHHMGTTRMGVDPATSVVTPHGRVHDVTNLYAAGASVFPTSGCANPTLTLVALAIRMAEHLRRDVFGLAPSAAAAADAAAEAEALAARARTDAHVAAARARAAARDVPPGARRVLVIGAGQRVQTDVLPALAALGERFFVNGVFARTARTLELGGDEHLVLPLDRLTADDLAACDLIYVAVSKGGVPKVLRRLAPLDRSGIDLVIDTPVMLFKHLGQLDLLRGFRNAWVAEDCSTLPWVDLLRQPAAREALGDLRAVTCDRSAWRYHGLALLKTLFGGAAIRTGRRRAAPGGERVELGFAGGGRGTIVEPRDYAAGRFVITGTRATASDAPAPGSGELPLELVVQDGACRGLRLGSARVELDPAESALVGPVTDNDTITSKMDQLKRVGLARMLATIHGGGEGYPLDEALDDMAVDYYLEKLRRYRANPLMSIKSRWGRKLVGGAMRLASRG